MANHQQQWLFCDEYLSPCLTQVTIIIYLSVVGALLLYMLFLLLVDPLIRKREPYTQPLHNEEDSEVHAHTHLGGPGRGG